MFIVRYTYSNKHTYVEREREGELYTERERIIYIERVKESIRHEIYAKTETNTCSP